MIGPSLAVCRELLIGSQNSPVEFLHNLKPLPAHSIASESMWLGGENSVSVEAGNSALISFTDQSFH